MSNFDITDFRIPRPTYEDFRSFQFCTLKSWNCLIPELSIGRRFSISRNFCFEIISSNRNEFQNFSFLFWILPELDFHFGKNLVKSQLYEFLSLFFRLCNSSKVCRDLIRLSGVDRLVELCQNPSERNFSDAVLVSCLAVLRRLNANLDQNEELQSILHQMKALNLIRTNLVDSFMEYSTKQESLV